MEGGFQGNEKKYDIEELYSVVVMPGWTEINLTSPDIPAQVGTIHFLGALYVIQT